VFVVTEIWNLSNNVFWTHRSGRSAGNPSGHRIRESWYGRRQAIGDRQASRLQQEIIQDLVPIADGKSLSEASIRRLLDRARHLTITPHGFDLEAGAVVFLFSFWNWAAIASYEVLALAEARRRDSAFPGDLRRCRRESCGKFFFMGDLRQTLRGRPRSLYCSKAHMFEQHSTGNARRVALHRERWRASRAAEQPSDGHAPDSDAVNRDSGPVGAPG
jgi:hypothetical protein